MSCFTPFQGVVTKSSCHKFLIVSVQAAFILYFAALNSYSLSAPTMAVAHGCGHGFSYKVHSFSLLLSVIYKSVCAKAEEETKKVKSRRRRTREGENMNPSHVKCNLIHFTVVPIEGGIVWSPHRRKNLYTMPCSCECSQTAMLRGKLTVCLNRVPLQQII